MEQKTGQSRGQRSNNYRMYSTSPADTFLVNTSVWLDILYLNHNYFDWTFLPHPVIFFTTILVFDWTYATTPTHIFFVNTFVFVHDASEHNLLMSQRIMYTKILAFLLMQFYIQKFLNFFHVL
jgi:hypothetical protein